MTAQFGYNFNRAADGTETIVLFGSQGVRLVPDSHANFEAIKANLLEGSDLGFSDTEIEDMVFELADAVETALAALRRLSDRVTIKGDKIFFDGDEMENKLTKHIVAMIKNGDDNYKGYVLFLENVRSNPSKASRKSLFKFLDKHDLVITDDGCFIGYKGVGSDGLSITAGSEDVTVTLPDGTVETYRGHIPYRVGAVVEMPRSLVDPNRDVACSVGLHVGNHRYASDWGRSGKLLTVKVNPRDVVSVPSDSNDEKIRAHRLTVLEVNERRERYEGTSFNLAEWLGYDAEGQGDEDESTETVHNYMDGYDEDEGGWEDGDFDPDAEDEDCDDSL